MADYLGIIQQVLFFGFVLTAGFVAIIAASLPLLLPRIDASIPAPARSSLYTLLCIFPVMAAGLVIFLAMLPSILEVLGINKDHCLGHQEGHIHFCLVHRHEIIDHWMIWLPAMAWAGMLAGIMFKLVNDLIAVSRFRDTLLAFPRRKVICHPSGTVLLNSRTPLALSCGIFKPAIYLSTGLQENLSADEVRLVIAHEKAHGDRHDSFRMWLARGFSAVFPPGVRRQLLLGLDMACEQASDEAALGIVKDPGTLASLLLKIERQYQGFFPARNPLAPSVTGTVSLLEHRIRHLVQPREYLPVSPVHVGLGLLLMGCLLLLAHDAIHNVLEHFLTWLVPAHHL